MIGPRWRKVFADLWINKTRTLLTVLTILVAVFAVGLLRGVAVIMVEDMDLDYQAANPHAAIIYAEPFDDALVKAAGKVPGVADVEGRSSITARAVLGPEKKVNLQLVGINTEALHVDTLRPADATGAPLTLVDHEVWIETSSLGLLPLKAGDTMRVELAKGQIRELHVTRIVRDVSSPAAAFTNQIEAFVTPKTIEWLGGTSNYNQLLFTVAEQRTDKKHVETVAQAVSERMRKGGSEVSGTNIYNPGRHFSYEIFMAITTILNVLGGAIIFLCIFLVINTINTLISQHVRFIGIMKSLGGQFYQLLGMYLVLILSFGIAALCIAVPLGSLAAYAAAGGIASFVNVHLQPFRIVPGAVIAQILTALGVPLIAGLVPVINGARITIREALSNYGIKFTTGAKGPSLVYRVASRFLSRPGLISLQNTFRRRSRLIMMLTILSLGGAVFIAVFNLWTTFDRVTQHTQGYFLANINIYFSHPYRLSRLEEIVKTMPDISGVEGWTSSPGEVLAADSEVKNNILIFAPPAGSRLIKPDITAGRWLLPSDQNAIVIGNHMLKLRPDLRVGDELTIRINDKDVPWQIVGIYKLVGNTNPPILYTTSGILNHVLNQTGLASNLRITTTRGDAQTEQRVAKELEALFTSEGIQVTAVEMGFQWRASQASILNVLIYFLLVMAVLIALVGGLGLMSTMGMNVLERTREIGVMRAIGASNGEILRLVLGEGLLIGVVSWGLAILLSFPLTLMLNTGVGAALFSVPLDFAFGWNGVLFWLVGILFLASLSSLAPALNAVRLTVRDVLAYE